MTSRGPVTSIVEEKKARFTKNSPLTILGGNFDFCFAEEEVLDRENEA